MSWKKIWDMTFSSQIFSDDAVHADIIHEYVVMYLANQRQSSAHTKTRGEVKRSWRKLYNQKWWGRARVGDAWSPIRRKWWVAMWPRKERNRSKTMPDRMKKRALSSSLTLKLQADNVVVLSDYDASNGIKTKSAHTMLHSVWCWKNKTLVVFWERNDVATKSLRNIPWVSCVSASLLNTYDVMCTKKILFLSDAIPVLEKRLAK